MSWPGWRAALAVFGGLVLALPALPAHAHSPIAGVNDFYAGALHPFVSPAHLIALLALGLAIGQRAQGEGAGDGAMGRAKAPLLALLLALPIGLATHRLAGDPANDHVLLVLAAGLGLAVAARRALPQVALVLLAAVCAIVVGWGSGPGAIDGRARWMILAGTGAAALLLVSYVAIMTSVAARPWLRIAVRVVGSWLAAAALLVLALGFAPARAGVFGA